MNRRQLLQGCAGAAATALTPASLRSLAAAQNDPTRQTDAIVIDPKPLFDVSPHLHMQFMEPLGVTDSSVEAAWDYNTDDWRRDFIATTKDLAPDVMRFGGLLSRYYKWREGVGPADKRPWYRNYVWGGKETHRVGTHEFLDFCKRVGSEPLWCVNFLGDGDKRYKTTHEGDRTGDATEAADWVSYCNDPNDALRKSHGVADPYGVKLWQLGNETSYGGDKTFSKDQSIAATIDFAKAMRARDPSLQLIGWGDNNWAADLVERAGEHINQVAVHMMQQTPIRKESALHGNRYQAAPEKAWEELMEMVGPRVEQKLLALEAALDGKKSKHGIAITEGHLSLNPHNSNPILTEWLTGVYHARVLNLYQRHGDRVKIATGADFNGNRWTTNAIIHQVPGGVSYLLPAGAVARLFKRHNGKQGIAVKSAPGSLDIAATRTGDALYLHVANMNYNQSTTATFAADGLAILSGKAFEISPENPRQEVSPLYPNVFKPREQEIPKAERARWTFPARSVTAIELQCAPA